MDILDYFVNDKITIYVKTNSSKNKIVEWLPDKKMLKVEIKALPEKGKANLEIVKFFSKLLKKKVKISSGLTSKRKVIRII